MNDNQKPSDFVFLAAGVMTVIGSFCPWISVSFISVRGTDGWRGLVVIVAGIVVSVFAASRLWESLVKSEFKRRLHYLSIFSTVISIGVLSEVGFKTLKAAREFSNLDNSDELGLGEFGNVLGDFSNDLAGALKPKIAFGWYLSSLSIVLALVLALIKIRKVQSTPNEVMLHTVEGAPTAGTMLLKRKSLVLALAVLALMVATGLYIFTAYISTSSSETASSVYIGNSSVLKTCFRDYCTGDTGPGGGTIIYVDKDGFTGFDVDDKSVGAICPKSTCHYLEMSLVALEGEFSWQEATVAAEAFSTALTDDWVLPSRDVLEVIDDFPHYLSNIGNDTYWSSSEDGVGTAWGRSFAQGDYASYKKELSFFVRPVRAF
jgi:hypothetical protein